MAALEAAQRFPLPTLICNSEDDPICPAARLRGAPYEGGEGGATVALAVTARGGHLGWLAAPPWRAEAAARAAFARGGADGGAAAALGEPGPRAAAEACPCQPWVAKIAEEFVAHLLASRT